MRPSRFLPWSSVVCAELWPRRSASPQALQARAIALPTASGAAWCSCGWRAATRMRCCAAASPGCWHVTRGAGARGRASASAAGGACCCSSCLTVKLFRMLRGLSRCRSLLLSFAIVCVFSHLCVLNEHEDSFLCTCLYILYVHIYMYIERERAIFYVSIESYIIHTGVCIGYTCRERAMFFFC